MLIGGGVLIGRKMGRLCGALGGCLLGVDWEWGWLLMWAVGGWVGVAGGWRWWVVSWGFVWLLGGLLVWGVSVGC